MSQATPPAPMDGGQLQPHRGVMILIFGILSIVCCFIFGIVSWVMGNNDLASMASGRMDPTGEGLTKAGKICGIVGIVLAVVGIVVQVIMLIAGGGIAAMSSGSGP